MLASLALKTILNYGKLLSVVHIISFYLNLIENSIAHATIGYQEVRNLRNLLPRNSRNLAKGEELDSSNKQRQESKRTKRQQIETI